MIWNATKDSTENIVTKKTKLEQNSCWILNIKIPDLLPCITKCILKEIVNSQEMITEIDCSPNYFCTSMKKALFNRFFSILIFLQRQLQFSGQQGKGEEPPSLLTTVNFCSQRYTYLVGRRDCIPPFPTCSLIMILKLVQKAALTLPPLSQNPHCWTVIVNLGRKETTWPKLFISLE